MQNKSDWIFLFSGFFLLGSTLNVKADELPFFEFSIAEDVRVGKSYLETDKMNYVESTDNEVLAVKYAGSLHASIRRDQKKKVNSTLDELKYLSEKFPLNSHISAFYASVGCMSARDTWFIPSKISRVNDCIANLEKAVVMSDEDVSVRAIRAASSLKLPKRFGQQSVAIEDIEMILKNQDWSEQHPLLYKARLLTQLVVLYGEFEDSVKQQLSYEKLLRTTDDTVLLEVAKTALL